MLVILNDNQSKLMELLSKLKESSYENSLQYVADELGYNMIKNPVDPESEWYLLSHPELDPNIQAVISLRYDEDLNEGTPVRLLRKRFELVEEQKANFKGFVVYLYIFVGSGRILIYRGFDSNRDERLDLSEDSIQKVSLYADNFFELSRQRIKIAEDEFGFGKEIVGLEHLFKHELSNLFTLTVLLYKKRIAEAIAGVPQLENKILRLLPSYDQDVLRNLHIKEKLLNPNYKEAIGSVIDTIVLRVVLRRFLESYHGLETFAKQDDFKDLGLGYGQGKI